MDDIKQALQNIRKAASKRKQKKDVEESIGQLSPNTWFDRNLAISTEILEQTCALLRAQLLPLYQSFPVLALRLCSAIITEIQNGKVLKAVESKEYQARTSWELVQTSLLSGILDYVEDNPRGKFKLAIGNELYPVLCRLYFPNSSSQSDVNENLLCTVYQLLSESTISEAENQHKLRTPDLLGGKRLGTTLAHIKDYLPIEALLELIANLIPSAKLNGGREKRSQFIGEIFDTANFACGKEILQCLESIKSPEWGVTSIKIINAMARSDITFPQPFFTTRIIIRGMEPKEVDQILIDNKGLLANLDEDGKLETFRIPFSIISSIKLSAPSLSGTAIKAMLTSPPLVGEKPVINVSEQGFLVMWELRNDDLEHFIASMSRRGLAGILNQSQRKLSKAKAQIELDFAYSHIDTPSMHDKVQNIARIWNSQATIEQDVLIEPTSPLVSALKTSPPYKIIPITKDGQRPNSTNSEENLVKETSTSANFFPQDSSSATALAIATSEDKAYITELDHREQHYEPILNKPPKEAIIVDSDSDSDSGMKPNTCRLARKLVIASDDDSEPTAEKLVDKAIVVKQIKEMKDLLLETITRKRKLIETETTEKTETLDEELEPRLIKRFREERPLDNKQAVRLEVKVPRNKARKYDGKPRTSSPILVKSEVDFDELPNFGSPRTTALPLARNIAPRIATMKCKDGKTSSATLKATLGNKAKTCTAFKETTVAANQFKVRHPTKDIKQQRTVRDLPAYTDKKNTASKFTTAKNGIGVSRKPKYAPWETVDFIHKEKERMEQINDITNKTEGLVPRKDLMGDSTEENDQSTRTLINDMDQNQDVFSKVKHETSTPELDINFPKRNDVIMIDLTQDEPPMMEASDQAHQEVFVNERNLSCMPPFEVNFDQAPLTASPVRETKKKPKQLATLSEFSTIRKSGSPTARILGNRIFPKVLQPNIRVVPRVVTNRLGEPSTEINSHYDRYKENYAKYKSNHNREPEDREYLSSIVDVIGEITEVIIGKMVYRFDDVQQDIQAGRASILHETAYTLENMRAESVVHFNKLVDLEEKYAMHSGKIITEVEDMKRVTEDVVRCASSIVKGLHRSTLSKRFPKTLFAKALPTRIRELVE